MNPIQIVYGIETTAKALVSELRLMSREIEEKEIAHVAAVSAGNDYIVGNMIAYDLRTVGQNGFIRIETGRGTENTLEVVRGMQFERGYLSPFFVTDRATMSTEFNDCKILLVDKIITKPKEILNILDGVKGNYPLLVIAEGVDMDALAPIIRNKLKCLLKVAVIKAPAFGERKSDYLDDIAILTGGTVIRDAVGLTLEKAGIEVLGCAVKVSITKDSTLLVTDVSTQAAVEKRVAEVKSLVEVNFILKTLKIIICISITTNNINIHGNAHLY
ncbi:hypothetical protein KSP39_PZI017977 [Platanthera zijinensis]|uniref:Uncharacterized protein n=1 Tax=Platanthera zijinensis TaxID=2320716 RepID=A0AAP0FZH4_9ASPA